MPNSSSWIFALQTTKKTVASTGMTVRTFQQIWFYKKTILSRIFTFGSYRSTIPRTCHKKFSTMYLWSFFNSPGFTFEALTAPAGQKVAAKCAEAIRHCAQAGQTTDIDSYNSRNSEVMHIVDNLDTTMQNRKTKQNTKTQRIITTFILHILFQHKSTFNLSYLNSHSLST